MRPWALDLVDVPSSKSMEWRLLLDLLLEIIELLVLVDLKGSFAWPLAARLSFPLPLHIPGMDERFI